MRTLTASGFLLSLVLAVSVLRVDAAPTQAATFDSCSNIESAAPPVPSVSARRDILYSQDFSNADPITGLPPGWSVGPNASVPYFDTFRSTEVYGNELPALGVELPLAPLNYRVGGPHITVPDLADTLTLEFTLRLEMADAPFYVQFVPLTPGGAWLGHEKTLLELGGETMDGMRTYRVSFQPWQEAGPGRIWIVFGLSYKKALREGRFWVDDLVLSSGRSANSLEFYVTPQSAAVGTSIDLHVSSQTQDVTCTVFRERAEAELWVDPFVLTECREQDIPPESWKNGCAWPVSGSIETTGWPSGVYTVRLDNGDTTDFTQVFLHDDGSTAPPEWDEPVLILPLFTSMAYNDWGGRSFYSSATTPEVCFDRPVRHPGSDFFDTIVYLVRWLERTGQPYRVATDLELHEGAACLRDARLWIIPGHSEYWTRAMRRETEAFIARGGSVLVLGGNVLWWQSRIARADDPVEPGQVDRLVCYKYMADLDPYQEIDPSLVTTHWDEPPLNESATQLFGLSWRTGGMVNWGTASNCPCEYDWHDGHGGYTVLHPEHWIFDGTGLSAGAQLGQRPAIVGYEVDGVPHSWVLDLPVPTEGADVPPGTILLGHASAWNQYHPDNHGDAFMAIRETPEGGVVFHAGTTWWCWGLADDDAVQQVTWNLIHRERRAASLTGGTSYLSVEPNPSRGSVDLLWHGVSDAPDRVELYSVDGRRLNALSLEPTGEGAKTRWDFRDADGSDVPPGVYFARTSRGAVGFVRLK
ncbi:MAG: hypothetical protein KDA27_18245 [Candidatus Eisenbacteria bacterium]|uniref:N,N-dimethylformamidase beta subunit-like C-terminal domain-containing protein n=1 Tax=Eiseniibacteriota bacterium TaxID=2212470 RepID=A0A956SGU0_UNCEI|nr:hypothetical protein [Candidatus Eisenbacteria bacterium]